MSVDREQIRRVAEPLTKSSWPVVAELLGDDGWFAEDEPSARFVACVYPNAVLALLDELEQAERDRNSAVVRFQVAESRLARVPALVEAAHGLVEAARRGSWHIPPYVLPLDAALTAFEAEQ